MDFSIKDLEAQFIQNADLWGFGAKKNQEKQSKTTKDILAGLNPEQYKAVTTTEGPVLVVAGAGTGKTRVLTSRIANIIDQGLAKPEEILAVTFTNKAAKEMKDRITQLIGERGQKVRMGSFHAVSLVMLRHHPRAAGLMNDKITILDEADQNHLLNDLAKDLHLIPDNEGYAVINNERPVKEYIQSHKEKLFSWKEEGWLPNTVGQHVDLTDSENKRTYEFYRAYQEALSARNACDFSDLLLHMVQLFRNNPEISKFWSERFKYILVDEFQDTNPLQYEWLKHLGQKHKNICVVGDPDQSIYEWRNARPQIMLDFSKDWPGTQVITVDQNYRSTQQILDVANAVLPKNATIGTKQLKSNVNGVQVAFDTFESDLKEAEAIADQILELSQNGVQLSEIAILFRSSPSMKRFEEQLMKKKIPYNIIGGQKFYEREEIKDALSYLRLAIDPRDELAYLRIANKPARWINEQTAMKVVRSLQRGSMDIAVACRDVAENEVISNNARLELESFADQIEEFNRMANRGTNAGDLILHILERISYISWRIQTGDEKAEEREEMLNQLIKDAQLYPDASLFLQTMTLLSDADTEDTVEGIRLSTIHASKGLEFDYVFTPALEEGVLPNLKSLKTEYGENEERRIAHVAWTRARKNLMISNARIRFYQKSKPSRFLVDIGFIKPEDVEENNSEKDKKPIAQGIKLRRRKF